MAMAVVEIIGFWYVGDLSRISEGIGTDGVKRTFSVSSVIWVIYLGYCKISLLLPRGILIP